MRYVVAVAEERSFTRAAQRCHVVQSALSHQIKALERELGVTLFARSSQRVEVTAAGEGFLVAARESLDAAQRAITEATAATGQVRGELSLGVIPTVTALDLPAVLGEFHRAHPAVRINVRGGSSDQFLADLADGSLDVAVLGLPGPVSHRGVAVRELARERHVAVVAAGHRLARRKRLRLEELAEETFADFPATSPGREQSDRAFHAHGLHREVAFEVMSADLILDLVRHGLATALLTPGVVPVAADLRTIAVVDGPTRVECLAWRDFNPSPAARAFLELLTVSGSGPAGDGGERSLGPR